MAIKALSQAWIDAAQTVASVDVKTEAQAKIEIANELSGVRVRDDVHAEILIAQNVGGAPLPATQAIVSNGATAPVQNSAGAAIGTGTITIASNAVSNIRLPATVAGVSNGAALTVPVTGTYTTTATIAVANGVITGITLS